MNSDGTWSWTLPLRASVELAAGEISAGQLTFVVTDEHGASSTGILAIELVGSNDAPVRIDAAASVAEDGLISGTYAGVDPDPSAVLRYSIDPRADAAGFTLTSDGRWQFDAAHAAYQSLAPGQVQEVQVGIITTDEHGANVLSLLTISVSGANDAPLLGGSPAMLANGTEDVAFTVTGAQLLAGWSDVDGGTLAVTGLTASHGTVAANGTGGFVVTPSANHNGAVTLNYSVSDGQGGSTAAALSLSLAPVNDAPRLTGTPPAIPAQVEDTAFVVSKAHLLAGWTDADGDALTLSNFVVSGGTVASNTNGLTR